MSLQQPGAEKLLNQTQKLLYPWRLCETPHLESWCVFSVTGNGCNTQKNGMRQSGLNISKPSPRQKTKSPTLRRLKASRTLKPSACTPLPHKHQRDPGVSHVARRLRQTFNILWLVGEEMTTLRLVSRILIVKNKLSRQERRGINFSFHIESTELEH